MLLGTVSVPPSFFVAVKLKVTVDAGGVSLLKETGCPTHGWVTVRSSESM
jgi:hypothetical protein